MSYFFIIFGTEFTGSEFTGTKFTGTEFTGHRKFQINNTNIVFFTNFFLSSGRSPLKFGKKNEFSNNYIPCMASKVKNCEIRFYILSTLYIYTYIYIYIYEFRLF